MLNKIKSYIRQNSRSIQGKIAFYPTLLAITGFAFSLFMIWAENTGMSKKLIDVFPILVLEDGDTAKTILSVCVAGLISMMVFSFSMVMLLLSQASSNFSPRLLPGLISDKQNQIVLGSYLATIVYIIFTLFNIESTSDKYTLPGVSILLGILGTLTCFGAFIYFIHSISQSIQINNILDSIHTKAIDRLEINIAIDAKQDSSFVNDFPDRKGWKKYPTVRNGYLQDIDSEGLHELAKSWDTKLYVAIPKGMYVLKNIPFIESEQNLDENQLKDIFHHLKFGRGELISSNFVLAFKQITEIITKAMSPGINDPGTAVNGIDYLTNLFALRMEKTDSGVFVKDDEARIKIAIIHFDELLSNVMASIRTYSKQDPIIMQKLFWMMNYLQSQEACDNSYHDSIRKEILLLNQVSAFQSPQDHQVQRQA